MLTITEIYCSIQGESTYAGLPCVFIRLSFCNLRCSWCDTEYSFSGGDEMSIEEIVEKTKTYGVKLVEVTGGEPLFQEECIPLMAALVDEGFTVLLETGGSLPINEVDPRVVIIMDLKAPSSRMTKKNRYENIPLLKPEDEVKFVVGSEEDYKWSLDIIRQYRLEEKCRILLSPVFGVVNPQRIVDWMLRDGLNARFQLQLHKFIWPPETKGV